MKFGSARVWRGAFWVYVAATFAHIAYVVNREPFSFDAWNVADDTGAQPATLRRFFAFWYQQYTTSNPRIGQPLTYLAYKIAGVAEIVTPIAFFAIVLAGFVVGLGRWPARRSGRDLAVLAIGIGLLWIAAPNLPAYMFCRAYATNYVWAIAIQLWFAAVLRLRGSGRWPLGIPALAAVFAFGVIAGMCNEHTGPALIALVAAYALWSRVRRGTVAPIVWVGLAGLLVGYALIFFAPGQGHRYTGFVQHRSLLEQIRYRGIAGDFDILTVFLWGVAPVLALTAIAIAGGIGATGDPDARTEQRDAVRVMVGALVAGALISATLFASPLLGPRFYLHADALMLGAFMAVVAAFARSPRALGAFVAFAVASSIYAGARTIPFYTQVARASDARLAQLAAAPPGGSITLHAWPIIGETWWFLGDDVRDQKKQEMIARYFGLDRVLFEDNNVWSALGVSNVRLMLRPELDPATCLDQHAAFSPKPFFGADLDPILHAFRDELVEIPRATGAQLRALDLEVGFVAAPPPMPRDHVYVARFANGATETYAAQLVREPHSTRRRIVPSPELARTGMEIFVTAVGEPPRRLGTAADATLAYTPWRSGPYWILACRVDACFVVLVTSHVI